MEPICEKPAILDNDLNKIKDKKRKERKEIDLC
jgi:hypothetical protein